MIKNQYKLIRAKNQLHDTVNKKIKIITKKVVGTNNTHAKKQASNRLNALNHVNS